MAKGRKATAKFSAGITNDGITSFASSIALTKDSPKIPFEFKAPATLELAAQSADAQKWYSLMVNGAWANAARIVKSENDTRITLPNGDVVDALTMPRTKLARILTNQFQYSAEVKKEIPAKIKAIASKAVSSNILTRETIEEGTDKLTVFKPVPVAEIVKPTENPPVNPGNGGAKNPVKK